MGDRRPKEARHYRELLRVGLWFRSIPAELQDALLAAGAVRALPARARLFSRGDPPCGLYAVLDGAIRISGVAETGKEALLVLAEPPSWFGEIAVFDGLPRTHDATAEGDSLLLHVPQPALERILAAEPRHWKELGRLVAGKLRLAFLVIEDTAVLPPGVRLARRLVLMTEGYGDRFDRQRRVLEVRQEQLAQMLHVSRQTANQLLRDLEARGLIRLAYGEIEILDLDRLRLVASGQAADPAPGG